MLAIGHLSFDSPFILAPLAGYSDLPFRLLCRNFGAGYCVSEMISCHGLVYRQKNTLRMLASVPEERPVSFQLFGSSPEIMAEAAEIMCSFSPEMIDINMGCPVKKVTKRGAGAALMSQPELARKIVKAVVASSSVPVTAKIRSGPNSTSVNAPIFAEMLEDCGVAAITVHARTWAQGFTGPVDRQIIGAVKEAVAIPVIGNGDIVTHQQAIVMMQETGCDGVMIGRGALGNPWIFNTSDRPQRIDEIIEGAVAHLALIEKFLPAHRLLGYIKNHMCRYVKGFPASASLRKNIFAAQDLEELKTLLNSYRRQGVLTSRNFS
ncbi:MAG: tRNA dihydrouridine synthase DusB [Desulforhopalus sp.]